MLSGRVSRPNGETIETAKQMAGHESPEQMDSMPAGRMEGEGFSTREAFPFCVILFSGPVFGGSGLDGNAMDLWGLWTYDVGYHAEPEKRPLVDYWHFNIHWHVHAVSMPASAGAAGSLG